MQPRPPPSTNKAGLGTLDDDVVHQQQLTFHSVTDLEHRYAREVLEHACRCVGLQYDQDVKPITISRVFASLAEIDECDVQTVLAPFHASQANLEKFIDMINMPTDLAEVPYDENLIAAHSSLFSPVADASTPLVSAAGGGGDEAYQRFVSRLHRIYRNPKEGVPVDVIRQAEVALRRHNAHQKECFATLQRVGHACEQLQLQRRKYQRYRGDPSDETDAIADRATHRSPSRPSSAPPPAGSIFSVSTRDPAGQVTRLLAQLRKYAAVKRDELVREVAARTTSESSATRCSSSRENAAPSSAPRPPPQRPSSSSCAASSLGPNAFREGLAAHAEKMRKQQEENSQRRLLMSEKEERLMEAQANAERRRYDFLRNRELRCRSIDLRQQRIHEHTHSQQRAEQHDIQVAEEVKVKEFDERRSESANQRRNVAERQAVSAQRRREEAKKRAAAALAEKTDRARQKEQAYKDRTVAAEQKLTQRLSSATRKFRDLENHRKEALEKAKLLELQKQSETEQLRLFVEEDLRRRAKRNEYLASLRDEEAAIKEAQRRKLVEQFARAREFREQTFRDQWDRDLDRVKRNDHAKKRQLAALHDLQQRQEIKLRQILDETTFKPKDVDRMDAFIADIDKMLGENIELRV